MPDKCCVPKCNSNYDNQSNYVSVFRFPKDESTKDLWLKKIPRKDFCPGKRAVVCEKHFKSDEIIRDDELVVDGKTIKIPRKYPKLKDEAFPSIFENCPKYLSEPSSSTRQSRQQKFKERDDEILSDFLSSDSIASFDFLRTNIATRIAEYNIGQTVIVQEVNNSLFILVLSFESCPSILSSVEISSDLTVKIYVKQLPFPQKFYVHLTENGKLMCFNQLENILRIATNATLEEIVPEQDELQLAMKHLNNYISSSTDASEYSVFSFLLEQLELCNKSKMAKRYSNDLLMFSYCLYINSTKFYKCLRETNYLSLPSVDHLKRLCSLKLDEVMFTKNDSVYLQAKYNKIEEKDRLVNLLIDEIYVNQQTNYKGNCLTGFAANAPLEQASTIQSFMISSVFGKYKEIVKLIPVSKMSGDTLFDFTCKVLQLLDSVGYDVLCIISDNNSVNRKLFEKIAGSKSYSHTVKNPCNQSKNLFLLFDVVHLIKSIRNNWINQSNMEKTLQYPDFDNPSAGICNAHFYLLRKIFHSEKFSVIKYAPNLSYKSLYPKNIERQNVSLALRIFDERNAVALEKFSEKDNSFFDWRNTANFIRLLKRWWDMMNVSHLTKGISTRNIDSNAFMSIHDERLEFLQCFANWLKEWMSLNQSPRSGCLTTETFFALQQTSLTFPLIVKHLLQNEIHKDKFILSSKFQTDNLEGRFGQYRQMSGANYHISVQQVFESERKLKIKSILELHSNKYGAVPVNVFMKSMCESVSDVHEVDLSLFEPLLGEVNLDFLSHDKIDILIYIAGYCVFKLNLMCNTCSMYFISESNEYPTVGEKACSYIDMLTRGGLKFPTPIVVDVVCYAYLIFQILISNSCEVSFLQYGVKQHTLFVKLTETYLLDNNIIAVEKCADCSKQVDAIFHKILSSFGNICLNNYRKIMNDQLSAKADSRKLKKFKPH